MPPAQYWFTGTALATFIALVGTISTLGYGWYRAAVTEQESLNNRSSSEVQRRKAELVKGFLGEALASGTGLIETVLAQTDEAAAERDIRAWTDQTRDLIDAAYDSGEAELFMDSSGYIFYGDGTKQSNMRNFVDGRMRRITELLRRADSLTIRSEFDPRKFK